LGARKRAFFLSLSASARAAASGLLEIRAEKILRGAFVQPGRNQVASTQSS